MIWYALTIFWSAFLLFLVQPILGKQILPWFGGTPAVWTTCLLFFQMLLLGGYIYAHGLNAWLAPRAQALVHGALLAGSLWFLPIVADPSYRSVVEASPTWQILTLLVFTIGAPYFLISATGPLLQAWFARTHAGSPYRLYALSNVGSLLALLSYPFLVEPNLHLRSQTHGWSWGYVGFAVACLLCAAQVVFSSRQQTGATPGPADAEPRESSEGRPRWTTMTLWLGLAASASAMLMATTNQICQEVAVVPFLWILPLTLYLLTFIICFDSPRWYDRRVFLSLLVVSVIGATTMLYIAVEAPLTLQIGIFSLALFACAMVCHGELVRARPHAQHLTLFYLCVASGGALGGVLVALVAPAIFTGFWEYHLALVACCALAVAALVRDPQTSLHRGRPTWLLAVLLLAFMALGSVLVIHITKFRSEVVAASRNFYGVLRVKDTPDETLGCTVRKLIHGGIWHGMQLLEGDKRTWTTSYYATDSGIGLAILAHPRRSAENPEQQGLRVGVVGLGTGTIAALAQTGDTFRFYDINPDVIRIAQDYFYYLDDTPAEWSIVEGDARLELENELAVAGPQQYDILVMDAFSSDAIPMHLLTKECVAMYWQHLKPDGILVVNILNRNVDLTPVIRAMAEGSGKEARRCVSDEDWERGVFGADWAFVTSNQEFLKSADVAPYLSPLNENVEPVVWTDDYGSLWQVLSKYEWPPMPDWFPRWLPGRSNVAPE
ncbi:MAG TPA: fused MFS/spermidine synthase [Pirellulales bacterium]|jgi:SAM-dependent methyltransferase